MKVLFLRTNHRLTRICHHLYQPAFDHFSIRPTSVQPTTPSLIIDTNRHRLPPGPESILTFGQYFLTTTLEHYQIQSRFFPIFLRDPAMPNDLCSTCFRSLSACSPKDLLVHPCCQRKVCSTCTARNVRLATYCPFCDDVHSALQKRRPDVVKMGDAVFDFEVAHHQAQLVRSAHAGFEDDSELSSGSLREGVLGQGLHCTDAKSDNLLGAKDVDGLSALVSQDLIRKPPPPPYDAGPEFVIGDGSDTIDNKVSQSSPVPVHSALPPQTAKDVPTASSSKQSSDSPSAAAEATEVSGSTSSAPGLARYYLQPHDSVASIALRFGCTRAQVCVINGLPRTASHTPSVLHTRRYVDLPPTCHTFSISPLKSSTTKDHLPACEPEPRPTPLHHSFAAPKLTPNQQRQAAQARFQALVLRHSRTAPPPSSNSTLVLFPDERAARAYVALAEYELACASTCANSKDSTRDDDLDFGAVVQGAVSHWMMDSEWERTQRTAGSDPSASQLPGATTRKKDESNVLARSESSSSSVLSRLFGSASGKKRSGFARLNEKTRC